MKKNIVLMSIVLTMIIGSVAFASNTTMVYTPYGVMTGTCGTNVTSVSNVNIRKVYASTSIPNAVPNIYARVQAYVNNNIVFNSSQTNTDSTYATATAGSSAYVNSSIGVQGFHAIWSATYARREYVSTY